MEDTIKITPDKEKSRSLLSMADLRIDAIGIMKENGVEKFCSKIVEEYYEAINELVNAVMSADGYKVSEFQSAHIISISYMKRYSEFSGDILLMDNLRRKRNGIKYYGRHVGTDYLNAREKDIVAVINKLKRVLMKKLKS